MPEEYHASSHRESKKLLSYWRASVSDSRFGKGRFRISELRRHARLSGNALATDRLAPRRTQALFEGRDEAETSRLLAHEELRCFFKMSRSSLRMRTSRRSRSFCWARHKSSFDTRSVPRCAVIHLFSADMPTPRSSATCLRVSPLVSAMRTASFRNSSVRFSPIVRLSCCKKCYQRSGIRP